MSREVLCDLEQGANITLSTLRTTVHLGSHADGPNHYGRGEAGIGEQPLDRYIGPCRVVRAKVERGARVRPEDIEGGVEGIDCPRVLIRTGTFPDHASWNEDFAGLSVELELKLRPPPRLNVEKRRHDTGDRCCACEHPRNPEGEDRGGTNKTRPVRIVGAVFRGDGR
jgi:hypothetical protein